MKKVLKLKLPKGTIRVFEEFLAVAQSKRNQTYIEQGRTVSRETVENLLSDYDRLLKIARKAGYKIERPSGVRDLGPPLTDDEVPAFLLKDRAASSNSKKEPKPSKKRRVRL